MSRFKTKARTVDLLGEKQIKDDATAISELFKNSHDADATDVELSVDTTSGTVVLWDNGHGMNLDEVETKWLTLGTDSKYAGGGAFKRSEQLGRVLMGEKGIGRLAISTLGRQTLMVTKRTGQPFVLAYVHWDIFRNGNLLLDETVIPVAQSTDLSDLAQLVANMKQEQMGNILEQGTLRPAWRGDYNALGQRILADIRGFVLRQEVLEPYLERWSDEDHGTLFYVSALKEDWEAFSNPANKHPRLVRKRDNLSIMMSSFINTIQLFDGKADDTTLDDVFSFHPRLLIDGRELLSPEVFTPEDLKCYDYGLVGKMQHGHFMGQALIQGLPPEDVDQKCTAGIPAEADMDCGEFEVCLYFVEGEVHNSHLSKDTHREMTQKLDRIGGVYIYRDALRVLPYGTPDFDFLEIEKRRTLNAGRYLFSLRRMFGYIAISKEENPDLEDKSSREGLRENDQYEYFRTVLKNLVVWWAVEYLNGEGRRKAYTQETEDKYRREQEEKELLARRERERKAFFRDLPNVVIKAYQFAENRCRGLETRLRTEIPGPEELQTRFLTGAGQVDTYFVLIRIIPQLQILRGQFQQAIQSLAADCRPSLDSRYSAEEETQGQLRALEHFVAGQAQVLSALLEQRMAAALGWLEATRQQYLDQVAASLQGTSADTFLDGLREEIARVSETVQQTRQNAGKLLNTEVAARVARYEEQVRALGQVVAGQQAQVLARWRPRIEELFAPVTQKLQEVEALLQRFTSLSPTDDLAGVANQIQAGLDSISEQVAHANQQADSYLNQALSEVSVPTLDALEQVQDVSEDRRLLQLLELRVRDMNSAMEQYRGLVTTGMAAEIVSHEFDQHYALIHQLLAKPANRKVIQQHDDLAKVAELFRHVEERHRMLSPLYQRSRLFRKSINVHEAAERMRDFFAAYLAECQIDLVNEVEPSFVIYESEAILYPVFINILSNSVHWLMNAAKRTIHLHSDAQRGLLFLEDSGPGISPEKAEKIFELFYTTRADGRGIGLHLIRELLNSRHHELSCLLDGPEKLQPGACMQVQFDPSSVIGK